ncbi:MAG: alpha-amylase family glycosyl hydrolase [Candidatus Cryptobacteroides sp.]
MYPTSPIRYNTTYDTLFVTDYLPLSQSCDIIESSQIVATRLDSCGRVYALKFGTDVLSTLDCISGGETKTLVCLRDTEETPLFATTSGVHGKSIHIEFEQSPDTIVALWNDTRIPLASNGSSYIIKVPEAARKYALSYMRVYASAGSRLFNDILIPLVDGKVAVNPKELPRQDKNSYIIYSLMVDRFCNGDSSNDCPLNRSDVMQTVDYQGGDFAGILSKIKDGYFEDLGVNTIWMTPIVKNAEGAWGLDEEPFTRFSSYHGYWPTEPTALNPHFGTEKELEKLIGTAHDCGMNVIVDVVANHLHQESHILKEHPDWSTPMYLPDGTPNIRLFDDQRLTTWFDSFLPTMALDREEVREAISDSTLFWMENFDFDGMRHDAAKHIPIEYWRLLNHKLANRVDRPLYQIGETYGSYSLIRSYVSSGLLDGQFDFSLYHSALNSIATKKDDMQALASSLQASLNNYGYHHLMGNITGNHDKARFISLAGGAVSPGENAKKAGRTRAIGVGDSIAYSKLMLLEALMLTVPGVPCIYQGDEFGVPGAGDPDNRRMMQFDGYTESEQEVLSTIKLLTSLRRSEMPLLYGDLHNLRADGQHLYFERSYMGRSVVVALNDSDSEAAFDIPAGKDFSCHFKGSIQNGLLYVPPFSFEIITEQI